MPKKSIITKIKDTDSNIKVESAKNWKIKKKCKPKHVIEGEGDQGCRKYFTPIEYFIKNMNGLEIYFVVCPYCDALVKLTNSELPAFRRKRFWKLRKWYINFLNSWQWGLEADLSSGFD